MSSVNKQQNLRPKIDFFYIKQRVGAENVSYKKPCIFLTEIF
jgi:hypothetical protein